MFITYVLNKAKVKKKFMARRSEERLLGCRVVGDGVPSRRWIYKLKRTACGQAVSRNFAAQ
jgi:hypothetical protein